MFKENRVFNFASTYPFVCHLVIRSGDYYLFEGDPEDEDEECAAIEKKLVTSTSKESLLEEKSLQEVRNRFKGVSSPTPQQQQNMQRQHIKDAWPAIEPSLLDVLSHHTDPFTLNAYAL